MNRLKSHADEADLEALERVEIARRALADAERKAKAVKKKLRQKSAWPTVTADRRAVRASPKSINPRQPREIDKVYLAWVRRLPCVAGVVAGGCEGRIEAAHLRYSDASAGRRNPGMGRKPGDRLTTPLCHHHHQRDQHVGEEMAFWTRLGIEPGALTDALSACFDQGGSAEDGARVIREFAEASRKFNGSVEIRQKKEEGR